MKQIRKLTVAGAPHEMGLAHGQAYAQEIAQLTEERMRLSTDSHWLPNPASYEEIMALGHACVAWHEAFDASLMDEIRGMAEATGIGVTELVIMNGFTDFVDVVLNRERTGMQRPPSYAAAPPVAVQQGDPGGCTAFLVDASVTAEGVPYIGQTWDMDVSATPHVLMLAVEPDAGPRLHTFTITGCVGMIGMNEHGVAVGINNLSGSDGRPGVTWTFVIRKMLAQRTVDAALEVLVQAHLAGAHNYLLMGPDEAGEIQGYNIERTATRCHVTALQDTLFHTNHCLIPGLVNLERGRKPVSQTSSQNRLRQAHDFLKDRKGSITVDTLMELTKYEEAAEEGLSICAHARPDYPIETSGACIMSPQTRELWAVWSHPCSNPYEHFAL